MAAAAEDREDFKLDAGATTLGLVIIVDGVGVLFELALYADAERPAALELALDADAERPAALELAPGPYGTADGVPPLGPPRPGPTGIGIFGVGKVKADEDFDAPAPAAELEPYIGAGRELAAAFEVWDCGRRKDGEVARLGRTAEGDPVLPPWAEALAGVETGQTVVDTGTTSVVTVVLDIRVIVRVRVA